MSPWRNSYLRCVMCHWKFVIWALVLVFRAGSAGGDEKPQLPTWITTNPAFQNPSLIDSIKVGNGSLETKEKVDLGWLIHLNDKLGYGVEIRLEKLEVEPEDYLLIAGWPMDTPNFQQIKLLTGTFKQEQNLSIPNTKSFFVLYSAAKKTASPQLLLKYKRYGVCYEKNPQPTESPVKKEIVYEVQFKGKPPNDYSDPNFLNEVKEVIRATAKRYCLANNIPFYDNISTSEMVMVHRISHCPFEWPERDICVSLQHSVFVSGRKIPGGLIVDYQLTASHLKIMWADSNQPELENLGITVFKLPGTSGTILWWSLIVGIVMASSLFGVFIFWSVEKLTREIRFRSNSRVFEEVKRRGRPKLKLSPHQEVPPFMYESSIDSKKLEELASVNAGTPLKCQLEDAKPGAPLPPPIKNYFGGILFSNRSFEDDEGNTVELRPK